MPLKKKKPLTIPEGFCADDIRIESSICTGEKTIGFYDNASHKLCYSELVTSNADIDAFFARYGLCRNK